MQGGPESRNALGRNTAEKSSRSGGRTWRGSGNIISPKTWKLEPEIKREHRPQKGRGRGPGDLIKRWISPGLNSSKEFGMHLKKKKSLEERNGGGPEGDTQ